MHPQSRDLFYAKIIIVDRSNINWSHIIPRSKMGLFNFFFHATCRIGSVHFRLVAIREICVSRNWRGAIEEYLQDGTTEFSAWKRLAQLKLLSSTN